MGRRVGGRDSGVREQRRRVAPSMRAALRSTRERRRARALLALLVLAAAVALASAAQALAATEITNSGDNFRDGWYPEQGSLTPALVSGGTFGQLWSANVEGQVYAQPLLASGTLLVATEDNKMYGLDPATGAMRWPAPLNLGVPWKAADIGCGDLAPNIGVTATPVIDPSTNIAYMTHKTYARGARAPRCGSWTRSTLDRHRGAGLSGPARGDRAERARPEIPATDSCSAPGCC